MRGQVSALLVEIWSFPGGSVVKNLPANVGDMDLIPDSGRSPGVGYGNPLQSSCLGNPMNRGAGWAIVYGVTKESKYTINTAIYILLTMYLLIKLFHV